MREIAGRVADTWAMLALGTLEEHGKLRFTRLGKFIGDVSQKMLTKTLRRMEADGLVLRFSGYGLAPKNTVRPSWMRVPRSVSGRVLKIP